MNQGRNQNPNGSDGKIGKCKCGHSGDGANTDHVDLITAGLLQPGHGHCKKCLCRMFTWAGWMKDK